MLDNERAILALFKDCLLRQKIKITSKIDLTSENKNNIQGYFRPQKILREVRKAPDTFNFLKIT